MQAKQFLEQEVQAEPLKYCPGLHYEQLVGDPEQVIHI